MNVATVGNKTSALLGILLCLEGCANRGQVGAYYRPVYYPRVAPTVAPVTFNSVPTQATFAPDGVFPQQSQVTPAPAQTQGGFVPVNVFNPQATAPPMPTQYQENTPGYYTGRQRFASDGTPWYEHKRPDGSTYWSQSAY